MNKGTALYLALVMAVIILLYAGSFWRIFGLILFGISMIWTLMKVLNRKTGAD